VNEIQLETEKRLELEMRTADIPIFSELRMLGITGSILASQLDIKPNTATQYLSGRLDPKQIPGRHIPALMRVLDTTIKSWRVILKEFSEGKHGPVSDAMKWRIEHYVELVDYADGRLNNVYRQVWQDGPPKKSRTKGKK